MGTPAATHPNPGEHCTAVRGSARAIPAIALVLSAAMLLALPASLDALVFHDAAWHVDLLAFTGGSVGLAALVRAVGRALALARAARALGAALEDAPRLPGHPDVRVVDDARPGAWCVGVLRPQVVLSRGAVLRLSPEALAAVLVHERHHARRRDGLRGGIADVLAAALFLLPGAVRARERYAEVLELRADRAATRTASGRRGMASAMLTLDAPGCGVDAVRVDRLLGHPVRVQVPGRTLTSAASLTLGLIALAAACTAATGCVDLFLLHNHHTPANRAELLPVLFLTAALLVLCTERLRPRSRTVAT